MFFIVQMFETTALVPGQNLHTGIPGTAYRYVMFIFQYYFVVLGFSLCLLESWFLHISMSFVDWLGFLRRHEIHRTFQRASVLIAHERTKSQTFTEICNK